MSGRTRNRAITCLLTGDVPGVRAAFVETAGALMNRAISTFDVSSRVRLTKTPDEYVATREQRRELPYEALLTSGRTEWSSGERIRVYRARGGRAGLLPVLDEDGPAVHADPRDYDVEFYTRLLRETFAARLARAFTAEDFETVFADPRQRSLFEMSVSSIRPVLSVTD